MHWFEYFKSTIANNACTLLHNEQDLLGCGFKTNYGKMGDVVSVLTNPGIIVAFPSKERKPDIYQQWIRLFNQKTALEVTGTSRI